MSACQRLPVADQDAADALGLRATLILLIAVTLLGAALRMYSLADDNLWRDEGASRAISGRPTVRGVVELTMARDPHPPAYYLTLHFWRQAFGSSDAAMRGLSVLFGTAAIPAIFLVGRALFGTHVGLGAALLMAGMPTSLRYSQEARSYTMLSFLIILAWYFAIRLTRRRDPWAAIGFAITAILLPYTHYWGGPALFAVALISTVPLLVDSEHRWRLWQLAPGLMLSAALFVPWVGVIVHRQMAAAAIGAGAVFFDHVKPSSFMAAFGRPFGYDLLPGPVGAVAVLTGGGCAALVLWLWRGRARVAVYWSVGMLLIPVSLIAVIGELTTFWIGVRVPNVTMVPTAVICAAAVAGLWRGRRAAAIALSVLLAALCAQGIWSCYSAPPRPDWEGVAAVIEAEERPGDVIVTITSEFVPETLDHYYSGALPVRGLSRLIFDRGEIIREARRLWPEGGRMWLILDSPLESPAPQALRELASGEQYYRVGCTPFYCLDYPTEANWWDDARSGGPP